MHTLSAHPVSFTGVHRQCADDTVVTMKRAIQRALNARLLAGAAAAHSTPVRVLLRDAHVLPPRAGNTWPTDGVGLDEFLHNSDRGTLSTDVLRMATSLESDAPSALLVGVVAEVVAALARIKRGVV